MARAPRLDGGELMAPDTSRTAVDVDFGGRRRKLQLTLGCIGEIQPWLATHLQLAADILSAAVAGVEPEGHGAADRSDAPATSPSGTGSRAVSVFGPGPTQSAGRKSPAATERAAKRQ
ncbi:hypothetical protein [Methylobacterium frigidaeris]|uniref:Uncharacterized protein n=1 Tax=Methylobacterium frigidaeris TaxID=2038277 RepID=A0AA37H8E2_9HYPH|nr:hypothetical protein [Methylobacterium frigidaeris]GJD60859.1 hypothetical protein MPEAHAMD_0999 [Methylobacterium frigidaeris]